MARDVIWGPLPFVSFGWFAVAGPQAGDAAAVASVGSGDGVVLQTCKSAPHQCQGLGHHMWFHAILVLTSS